MASTGKAKRYPLVEWLSAGIGLAISIAIVAMLALEARQQRDGEPPLMQAVPVGLFAAADQFVLNVEVSNAGHQTGAGVQIEGSLKQGEAAIETSSATLDYVAGQSKRRAGLVFTQDPRRFQLELRIVGYEEP